MAEISFTSKINWSGRPQMQDTRSGMKGCGMRGGRINDGFGNF